MLHHEIHREVAALVPVEEQNVGVSRACLAPLFLMSRDAAA
jgi:hypothetical protein